MEFFLFAILGLGFCAIVGAILGGTRGHPVAGFFLGGLFGPIGIVITLLLDKRRESYGSGDDLTDSLLARPAVPSSAVIPRANVEALLDLKRLQDAGIITAAEFESKKAALLTPQQSRESSVRYRVKGLND